MADGGALRTYLGTAPGVGKTYAMLAEGRRRAEAGGRAGEVVLVDLPAEALRRRIASGLVYSADAMGGALSGYFQARNLEALGELGRAWMEGKEDEVGRELLICHGLEEMTPRPGILAGVSDSEWGERVIHRAADLAAENDSDLLVVHVDVADGLGRRREEVLDHYQDLTTEMGGTYTEVPGNDPADALTDAAQAHEVSRVVVARHRSRLGELARGSVAGRLRRLLPDVVVEEVRGRA